MTGRSLPEWRAEDGVAQAPPRWPTKTDERVETLNLLPYAAAKLRITAFPSTSEVTKPDTAD